MRRIENIKNIFKIPSLFPIVKGHRNKGQRRRDLPQKRNTACGDLRCPVFPEQVQKPHGYYPLCPIITADPLSQAGCRSKDEKLAKPPDQDYRTASLQLLPKEAS